ncbi:MAG: peptidylprolyl isomerase [Verrucomicrobia bacterium]|jgi:parvulin-like peptidyl-prolyl isomerase|nr:peptidylprolyl isomerase [Verrucomicrobiota bacterium]
MSYPTILRRLLHTFLAPLILAAPLARAADDVIARVGDQEIKATQVTPYLDNLTESDRAALLKNPAALSQAVRTLILQQILLKEAIATGWDKTPEVAEQLERLRQGAIAETYLQSIAKVPEGYPSEEEIKTVYEARKSDLQVPTQIRLAQIFIAAPKDAPKDAQDKAKTRIEDVAKAVKAGDFAAVARDKSEERETASRGGEVGWLAETQIQPEIRSKVTSLSKGSVTEPIRLADGWYVVKVLEVKEAHTATLDEVKDQLVKLLRTERARANREAYLAKLQQQSPIALDELGLSKLLGNKK